MSELALSSFRTRLQNLLHLALDVFDLHRCRSKRAHQRSHNIRDLFERRLRLYVRICIFTASSFFSPRPAGNVARDLAATDPRLRHAVPGDGRPLPVRIRRRREGPAGVSGTPEFCGELRQHLRNLD